MSTMQLEGVIASLGRQSPNGMSILQMEGAILSMGRHTLALVQLQQIH